MRGFTKALLATALLGVLVTHRPVHADPACTSGDPITVTAIPQLSSAAPHWEGHTITFSFVGNPSDSDECPCGEGDEDEFTYTWFIEKNTASGWVCKGEIDGDENGANWHSANMAPGEYRPLLIINDTPWNGTADFNDPQVERRGASFQLQAPKIDDFWQYAVAHNKNKEGQPEAGMLTFWYRFSSTCGEGDDHLDHLDNVSWREYVTYDGDDDPHDMGHDGNCFTSHPDNPSTGGAQGLAHNVTLWDEHSMPSMAPGKTVSYCEASQVYQQGYRYPSAPNPNDKGATVVGSPGWGWSDVSGQIAIKRYVEADPQSPPPQPLRYRITKAGETNTWGPPLP